MLLVITAYLVVLALVLVQLEQSAKVTANSKSMQIHVFLVDHVLELALLEQFLRSNFYTQKPPIGAVSVKNKHPYGYNPTDAYFLCLSLFSAKGISPQVADLFFYHKIINLCIQLI